MKLPDLSSPEQWPSLDAIFLSFFLLPSSLFVCYI